MRWLPLLFLLAACAGPLRPTGAIPGGAAGAAPDLPPAFSEVGEAPYFDRWWTSFGDVALDGLVDRALAGNLTIAAARARVVRACALARRAGAAFVPALDLDAGASATRSRGNVAGTRRTTSDESLSLGVSAAYEVDLWGRVRATRDEALFDAHATAADLEAARIGVAASVATTWYRLVEETAIERVITEQETTNRTLLDVVRGRFDSTQAPAADVLRQQQLVERNRGEAAESAARRLVLEHQLATLLGRPATEALPPPPPALPDLPPSPATGVPAEVLARRPDVRSAWLDVQSADRRLAASIADRYPRVALSAAAVLGGGGFEALFRDWLARIAADLSAPLFDGGERREAINADRALVCERIQLYGEALLQALRETEDALAREAQQRIALASLARQHGLARQVVDALVGRYGQGAASYLDVLAAVQTEQTLARDLVTGRRQLLEYRIDLHRALAGSWDVRSAGD